MNTEGVNLVKGMPVVGMQLEIVTWQADPQISPKPILMLKNSHVDWYDRTETESIGMDFFLTILKQNAGHNDDAYVMDMGINDGYLSALAASYEYGVICADGQPECVRNFNFAIALNGWENIQVYNKIVSDQNIVLEVQNGVCGGGSAFVGGKLYLGKDEGSYSNLKGKTRVGSTTVDDMVGNKNILYWHLDAEGSEIDVLKSGKKLLSQKRVQYLQVEFIPRLFKEYPRQALPCATA